MSDDNSRLQEVDIRDDWKDLIEQELFERGFFWQQYAKKLGSNAIEARSQNFNVALMSIEHLPNPSDRDSLREAAAPVLALHKEKLGFWNAFHINIVAKPRQYAHERNLNLAILVAIAEPDLFMRQEAIKAVVAILHADQTLVHTASDIADAHRTDIYQSAGGTVDRARLDKRMNPLFQALQEEIKKVRIHLSRLRSPADPSDNSLN